MFDFLKKKISGFIDGITKKEEAKAGERIEAPPAAIAREEAVEPAVERPIPVPETKREKAPEPEPEMIKEKKPAPKAERKKEERERGRLGEKEKPEPVPEIPKKTEPTKPEPARITGQPKQKPVREVPIKTELPKPELVPETRERTEPTKPEIAKKPAPTKRAIEVKVEAHKPAELPKFVSEEKREEKSKVRLSPLKAITSFITREVEISEDDVRDMLESLELELLESDVELGVAESIRQELRQKLVGAKVGKGELNSFVREAIRGTLLDTMSVGRGIDLPEYVRGREKPVKIVFLGINGAGKTTTIAKVAHLLMEKRLKVAFAAADTFRAAAIEQMEVHANRLNVRLIKRDYGSDPTSVAYDAVNYARAHGIDAILIDTAGRQDTNVNLINELKKMDRVIKPDLKIYIGESIAGSSIIEQVASFNREIGVDGVILTKLDCDPKGGTVISISRATGIPIMYIGTGQKYGDMERFDAAKMAERILG